MYNNKRFLMVTIDVKREDDNVPPSKKFYKEEIINAVYKIIEKEGFDSVNARRIAKELGGSVQPIYHNYTTMEELNRDVFNKIYRKYQNTMKNAIDKKHPYLAKGIAYVKFAKEYPEFYKMDIHARKKNEYRKIYTSRH